MPIVRAGVMAFNIVSLVNLQENWLIELFYVCVSNDVWPME